MGAGCSSVKTVTHPAFSLAKVKSVDVKRGRLRVACSSGHSFDHTFPSETLNSIQKGTTVYTYMTREGFTVTIPGLLPEGEIKGKAHMIDPECIIFTKGDDSTSVVVPVDTYKSSVDIRGKDVDAVLCRQGDTLTVTVTAYNPFLFYPIDTAVEVRLISRCRLRLNDMAKASPGKHNKHSQRQFQRLGESAVAYRKVKHDGNAFYRCIVTLYLEHLCRKTTPLTELDAFLEKVQDRQGYWALIAEHEEYQTRLLSLLLEIRKIKATYPSDAMVTLQPKLQDPSLDMAAINYIRLAIANFIALHHREQRYKRFIISDIKDVIRGVMKYGVEAEGLVKYAVPELLGLMIVQMDVSVDSDEVFETYYSPSAVGRYPVMRICKASSSTYHVLYPAEVQTIDGYDMEAHTYSLTPVRSEDQLKTSSLYHEILPTSLHAIVT